MLIFNEKLPTSNRNAIVNKINSISTYLGIDPNWLMAVINFETAGTFSPSIQNKYTNATGLIQFMPSTAIDLGTTVEALKKMSFLQQLEYVQDYYKPYRGRIKSFVDLYLATFYPIAMGKPESYVIGSHKGPTTIQAIANQNPIFDPFHTGKVTVGAIKTVILAKLPVEYAKYLVESNKTALLVVIAALAIGFIVITKN